MKVLLMLLLCSVGAEASKFDDLVEAAITAGSDSQIVIPTLIEAVKVWEPADKKERLSKVCSELGLHLMGAGQVKEAEIFFTRAISLDPSKSIPRVNRGIALTTLGRIEEAINDHAAVVRSDPENQGNMQNFCVALMSIENYARALQYCEKSSELSPDAADPFLNLARVYAELGRHNEAAETFATSKTKRLRDRLPRESLSRSVEAYITSLSGRWDEGEKMFQQLIQEHQGGPMPFAMRGLARLRQGRYDAAISDFDQAYMMSPETMVFALLQRAHANRKAGRLAVASEDRVKACRAGWTPACPKKKKKPI